MIDDLREQLQSSLGAVYTIERELPGGGMSRVFLAEERSLARKVVIKVLPPDLAGAISIERFKREISLAARLQHAHIVPLHSAGDCDGLPFYTMPFVEGDSLRVRLSRHGEFPISEAVRVLREIASALACAHEHGVLHRDVKPDNILLSGDAAMVTDFGVAKALESATLGNRGAHSGDQIRGSDSGRPITSLGVALGTPAYMAPEQVTADATIDHRADLYAFGALAYEVLTGYPLFAGRTASALLAAQISEAPEPVSARRPSVPRSLGELVMRCLEKRPADRPQSAVEIVHILDGIATPGAMSVSPHEVPRAVQGAAAPWRRWAWAGVVATGVFAVAIGAVVWNRATPDRPMLAVLPFTNLGQPADAYFALGVSEEISIRLASITGLGLVGSGPANQYDNSTRSWREIGRDLDVDYLLIGTVRWERLTDGGSRVRVSPQLIRARDQTSEWARSFEGSLSDVFSFQTAVAEAIAEALNVALPAPERRRVAATRTTNLDAYDAYLRGLSSSVRGRLFEPGSRATAITEFQRAATLDPSFAAAHARLALAYVFAERFGRDTRALDAASLHLQSAIALDSSSIETRLARGWYLLERHDLQQAHAVVQALIRETGSSSQALYLDGVIEEELDRPEAAIASYQGAEFLDPMSPDPPAALAGLYDAIGRHEEAVRSREHEITLTPENGDTYFAQAASYLLWRYDTVAARQVLQRGVAAAGLSRMARVPNTWILDWARVLPPALVSTLDTLTRVGATSLPGPRFDDVKLRFYLMTQQPDRARIVAESIVRIVEPHRSSGNVESGLLLGAAYVTLGRTEDARRESDAAYAVLTQITGLRRKIPGMLAAVWIDMATGRQDVAIERLESVTKFRSGFYISPAVLRSDVHWTPIRSHPRFERVLALAK